MKELTSPAPVIRLLNQIAFAAALFAVILSVLIIINWAQMKRADPLGSVALKSMNDRLAADPDNQQLREDIRTLDLLARKAYFTSRWQIRTGGYILMISVLIVVICMKTIDYIQKKIPEVPGVRQETYWLDRKISRKWIAITGGIVVLVSLSLAWFTHRDMKDLTDMEKTQGTGKPIMDTVKGTQPMGSLASDPVRTGDTGISAAAGSARLSDTIISEKSPSWAEIIRNHNAFRGPGGNGIVYQKNIPENWDGKSGRNIRWRAEVPLAGYNSPVVWNDRVFLSGADDNTREVYCFDANDGKILWRASAGNIAGTPSKAPAVNRETGQAAPSLTTDGYRVYAIFANGDLMAHDFNGKRIWAKNIGMPVNHYGHSSSLVMYGDLVIVQYDQRSSASVMAFSGKNGAEIWKTSRNVKISWASPVVVRTGARTELLLAAEPYVASYNPSTGHEYWKFDCISGEVGPSVAYANGIVFSVNEYSKLAAVKTGDNPELLWENQDYLSDVPSPVANDQYVFLVTSYGTAVCYDAAKGEKYWEHEFGNTTYASPILADGKVYIIDKQGIMHIVRADREFILVSEPRLGESSVCTPAMSGGRIYIRGEKNLYCIGK
jgi:outer membrane protein assembly factor BamB